MEVRDLMMPEDLTLDARTTLQDAARWMRLWDVEDVFVIDGPGERLHGLLTVRDIMVTAIASSRHPATIRAGERCDTTPPTVGPDDPADHAASLVAHHGLHRLPVVDDGRLVGAIWAADLLALTHT